MSVNCDDDDQSGQTPMNFYDDADDQKQEKRVVRFVGLYVHDIVILLMVENMVWNICMDYDNFIVKQNVYFPCFIFGRTIPTY